jgi:hypothetical protein
MTWLHRSGADMKKIAGVSGHAMASIAQVLPHYVALGSADGRRDGAARGVDDQEGNGAVSGAGREHQADKSRTCDFVCVARSRLFTVGMVLSP